MIEASGKGPDLAWRFAVASFTDLGLQVRHKDREVYQCSVAVELVGRHGPHVGFPVETRPVGDDAESFGKK